MKKLLENIAFILSKKEKKKFTLLVSLDLLTSILDIAFLLLLVFVVGFYTGTYDRSLLPHWAGNIPGQYPLLLISMFTVLFALKNLLGFFVFRKQFGFVYEVASRISGNNLSAYLDGSYEDYIGVDSSVQVRKISQQPVEFSHYVLRGIQMIIGNSILILLTIIPILLFNPLLFLLLMAVLIPPALLTVYVTRKRLAALRQTGKKNREKTIQHLQEALTGYVESNIYHRKDFFLRRYKHYQEKFNAGLSEHQVMQNLPSRLIEVFAILGLFLLVVFQTYNTGGGNISVLLIGGFMAAAYKIIPGIVKILNSVEQVKTYQFTVTDLVVERKLATQSATAESEPIRKIELSAVDFAYRNDQVLKNFNLELHAGDFAGLAGPSGRGKTTVTNILLGFLHPQYGRVMINGKPVSKEQRKAYWPRISYIKQQSFFIHDSVCSNIILEDKAENDRLKRVAELTGVDLLVAGMPDGMNAILSENAKNVSGGQRQRIVLARALYKDADLIILDEPFNELDRLAEDRMLDHFRSLAATGKIVLLITHNRESLSFCNKIISLDAS